MPQAWFDLRELTVSIPAPKGNETEYMRKRSLMPILCWLCRASAVKQSGTVPDCMRGFSSSTKWVRSCISRSLCSSGRRRNHCKDFYRRRISHSTNAKNISDSLSTCENYSIQRELGTSRKKVSSLPSIALLFSTTIHHQYQPPVLIKDDNLSIYILISIVDKDFPQRGLAEGLDAAWQSLGSPGSSMG